MATALLVGCYLYWLYCASRYGYVDSFNRPIIGAKDEKWIFIGYFFSFVLFSFSAGLATGGWLQRDKRRGLPVISLLVAVSGLVAVPVVIWLG